MRIVVDLDGTICPLKQGEQTYDQLVPLPGAGEKLRSLRAQGHYIIIQTARNMATCESNLGKVLKNVGRLTLDWLEKYQIEYDEIYFGKPNGHVYLDDRALRFIGWDQISSETLAQVASER